MCKYNPDYVVKPSETILYYLICKMSKELNIPIELIEDIIDGKAEIDKDISISIGCYLGLPNLLLYNKQQNFNKKVSEGKTII